MKRAITLQLLVVCICTTVNHSPLSAAEIPAELKAWLGPQTWEHDTSGPVISLGAEGEFDDTHVLSPMVAMLDDDFHMWYVGSRGSVEQREFKMGLATSRDGKTFTKHEAGPVFSFGDSQHSVLTPTLLRNLDGTPIRENGKLRMWFSATDFDVSPLHTLYETTSTDGQTWSEPSPPLLEGVYAPTILKEGEKYRLWYTDVTAEPWVFRHAESDDGRTWKVTNEPVLVRDQAWERDRLFYPHVVKTDDVYLLWYGSYWSQRTASTAIGFAVSTDGIHWHKHPKNPVVMPIADRYWESHYTTSESVIRLPDGSWRMWFATRKKPPFKNKYFAIGTAHWAGPPPVKQAEPEQSDSSLQRTSQRLPAPDANDRAAFSVWQAEARSRLKKMLGIPTSGAPLDPEQRETLDLGDIVAEKWILTSEPGSKLPAILWLPKEAREEKLPAVVLTFGHGGSKSQPDYEYIGQLYAKLGIACLAIDPMGEEERNPTWGMGTREHDRKDLDARGWAVGRPIMGKLVFDTMRGVDFLCSRSDIDPARIGVAGNSLGGAKASWMVALEPRLRFGIISGWAYDDILLDTKLCTMTPGKKLREMLTWPEFLSLAAPHCAVMIMNGDADIVIDKAGDGTAWKGTRATFQEVAQVYQTLGAAELPIAWFESAGGHRPYPAHQAALPFLFKYAQPAGLSAEQAENPPSLNFGRWGDANGLVYEKLYGTELHLRGATVVDLGISYIPKEKLAVLMAEERGQPEFTLLGWLKYLEAK